MRTVVICLCLFLVALCSPVSAVTIGQVDTFETGLDSWFAGGLGPPNQVPPVPPVVEPNGGPAGNGDAYLRITASRPGGPGSRVVGINQTQWAGNYIAAGVGSVGMDLINTGSTDLTIRLYFEDPMMGPPADEAVTKFGAFLPQGSGWMHFIFPITPSDVTALNGSATAALTNATVMRIINAPEVGDAVQQLGQVGVDNIQAGSAVPEPSSAISALGGLVGLILLRHRFQRCHQ